MGKQPKEYTEALGRIIEKYKQRPDSDSISAHVRQLRDEQASWKDAWYDQPNDYATSTIGSLANLVTERSKAIEQEKDLLSRIESLSKELSETKQKKAENEQLAADFEQALSEYQKQEEIKYLIGKLNKAAETHIRTEPDFLAKFAPGQSHNAFVMSIDIRSSTELMLNAKTPDDFARFITGLCDKLTELVIDNGGVFDKFTGDGVLAFFPDFYSGADAGYRALLTATKAISFFDEHYRKHRQCFRVVITGTGLGVGIDFGTVNLVNIGESLSVVGNPVVYACRLSAAPAGCIYVNQPAQEEIDHRYQANTVFKETNLPIKGSGDICVYEVSLKGKNLPIEELPWKIDPVI